MYLDGARQVYCLMADEERGVVERYKLGEDGRVAMDGYGDAVVEYVRGVVEIRRNVAR